MKGKAIAVIELFQNKDSKVGKYRIKLFPYRKIYKIRDLHHIVVSTLNIRFNFNVKPGAFHNLSYKSSTAKKEKFETTRNTRSLCKSFLLGITSCIKWQEGCNRLITR